MAEAQSSSTAKGLIFPQINRAPFNFSHEDFHPMNYALVYTFSRLRCHQNQWLDHGQFEILTALEVLIAPIVPEGCFLCHEAAVEAFIQVMRASLPVSSLLPRQSVVDIDASLGAMERGAKMVTHLVANLHAVDFVGYDKYPAALCLLKILMMEQKVKPQETALEGLAMACIAVAKRGQTQSSSYLDMIHKWIAQDSIVPAPKLDKVTIVLMWSKIKCWIDHKNVHLVIQSLLDKLPASQWHLKRILNNLPGEGITKMMLIVRAVKEIPEFNWNAVQKMFPKETDNFLAALRIVDGNVYYGYKKNGLGKVEAKNYPFVAIIARDLIVRVLNEPHLMGLRVWGRNLPCPKKRRIDVMIEQVVVSRDRNLNRQTPIAGIGSLQYHMDRICLPGNQAPAYVPPPAYADVDCYSRF